MWDQSCHPSRQDGIITVSFPSINVLEMNNSLHCLSLSFPLCLVCENKPWLACQIQLMITLINFNNGPICFMPFWFGYWLFFSHQWAQTLLSPRATEGLSSKEKLRCTWMIVYDLSTAEASQEKKVNLRGKGEREPSRDHWFWLALLLLGLLCADLAHIHFENRHVRKTHSIRAGGS